MKVPRLVLVALAALCLTACPDQDNHSNSKGSKSGNQSKPSYTVPDGDSLMLVALAGAVIGSAEMLRRRK